MPKTTTKKTTDTLNKSVISTESELPSSKFILVLFGETPADIKVQLVYRGDSRVPSQIFKEGFIAHGANNDLLHHVISPGEYSINDSAFISASKSKEVASGFPYDLETHGGQGFLYEIDAAKSIDVTEKALIPATNKGQLLLEDMLIYAEEQEVVFKSRVEPCNIRGAWTVTVVEARNEEYLFKNITKIGETFIPNSAYGPVQFWKSMKMFGYGITFAGAALDGMSLYHAYQQSQHMKSSSPFLHESARIIGGWSGALLLGRVFATNAALACRALGPLGAGIGGVAGGVAGSILGYFGGERLTSIIKLPGIVTQLTPAQPTLFFEESSLGLGMSTIYFSSGTIAQTEEMLSVHSPSILYHHLKQIVTTLEQTLSKLSPAAAMEAMDVMLNWLDATSDPSQSTFPITDVEQPGDADEEDAALDAIIARQGKIAGKYQPANIEQQKETIAQTCQATQQQLKEMEKRTALFRTQAEERAHQNHQQIEKIRTTLNQPSNQYNRNVREISTFFRTTPITHRYTDQVRSPVMRQFAIYFGMRLMARPQLVRKAQFDRRRKQRSVERGPSGRGSGCILQ